MLFGEGPHGGVLVKALRPGGTAERAGLRAGDLILRVGNINVVGLYVVPTLCANGDRCMSELYRCERTQS